VKALSKSFANFIGFMRDVSDLIEIHDLLISKRKIKAAAEPVRRRGRNLDVLRRAGIILLVTAWETHIEDVVRSEFSARLKVAIGPTDIEPLFNSIGNAWLEEKQGNNRVLKVTDLHSWAGEGWKKMLLDKFESDLKKFHSPNSENVKSLCKRYLNENDISRHWTWSGIPSTEICLKLDKLIERRGELVHRAESSLFEASSHVRIDEVKAAKDLIFNLVQRTQECLGLH